MKWIVNLILVHAKTDLEEFFMYAEVERETIEDFRINWGEKQWNLLDPAMGRRKNSTSHANGPTLIEMLSLEDEGEGRKD
jgi:hypothetical protein